MSQERIIPYIAGPPVEQSNRFFGRQDIFEQIIDEFKYNTHTAVALYGPRRIGKTSILKQLPDRLGPKYCTIQFDCQSYANKPLNQIIRSLTNTMARAAGMKSGIKIDNYDSDAIHLFRERFLPEFYAALGPNRHPVLLIDEFDLLDTPAAPLQPPAAVDFIEYLQRVIEQEHRLRFIFVTGRHPSDLSVHFDPLFKIFRILMVSVLDRSSAEQLVSTAVSDGSLIWGEGTIDRVLDLTGCHPFFTQLLCQSIWRRCYRRRPDKIPEVDLHTVEDEAAEVIRKGHGAFEWSWGQLSPAGRILWAVMAANIHSTSNTDFTMSRQALFEAVRVSGIRVVGSDLNRTPDVLVEADLLYLKPNGNYAFRVELMRRWVRQTKPLSILRSELQKLHPHAEALFQIGLGIYEGRTRKRNLREAEKKLQEVLLLNPNHVEARILLARVYHENGDSENAIRELEEAHRYDPGAARNAHVEILCAYGENLEFLKKEDEALKQYEKVLELSENDPFAHERISQIYTRRGDEARDCDDMETAISYYEKAGAQQKIIDVINIIKQQQINDLLTQARQFEQRDDWDRATQCYQVIIEVHGDTPDNDYAKQIERIQHNRLQRQQYNEAKNFIQQGNHVDAVNVLKLIIQRNPYYLDSADLLSQAVASTLRGSVARSRQSGDPEPPPPRAPKARSAQSAAPERRNGVFILHTGDFQVIQDASALAGADSAISASSPVDSKLLMTALLSASASAGTPPPTLPLGAPTPALVTIPLSAAVPIHLSAPIHIPAPAPLPIPVAAPVHIPALAPLPIPVAAPVHIPAPAPLPIPAPAPATIPAPAPVTAPFPLLVPAAPSLPDPRPPASAPELGRPLPLLRSSAWVAMGIALVVAALLAGAIGTYLQTRDTALPGSNPSQPLVDDTEGSAGRANKESLKRIESLIDNKHWESAIQQAEDLVNEPTSTAPMRRLLLALIDRAKNGNADLRHYQEAFALLKKQSYVEAQSHLKQMTDFSVYLPEKMRCLNMIGSYIKEQKSEVSQLLENSNCREIDTILNEISELDGVTKGYVKKTRADCLKKKDAKPAGEVAQERPGQGGVQTGAKKTAGPATSGPAATTQPIPLPYGIIDPFRSQSKPASQGSN